MAELLAYGTITIGGSESESRPACGAEPIVDVILDRVQPTMSLSLPGGSGASFSVALSPASTDQGGETWGVQSVSVTNGGSGYADGARLAIGTAVGVPAARLVEESEAVLYANVTDGSVTSVTIDSAGEYFMTGGVESVELVHGGAFYRNPLCTYTSDPVCPVCPDTYADPPGDLDGREELYASLQLGSSASTLTVWRRSYYTYGITPPGRYNDIVILSATRPNVDGQGNPIPCDELTFDPEHFSKQYSCVTNGTVTVTEGTCGDSSSSACDLPDQITLSASGIPLVIGHGSSSGFSSSAALASGFADHCGISPYCLISESTGGGIGNSWRASLVARDESSIVLDRDQNPGECGISYSGVMPSLPSISRSFNNPYPFGEEDCGGALEGRGVSVTISPVAADTSVFVSAPPWGQFGATAEATVSGGAVSGITVTNGGEGYAREVFARVEPTMTVTLSGGSGSGAVLTATLTQVGTGEEAYWYVSAVTVTNGGTGYSGQESVVFTPETGATTAYPAYAMVATGRTEPTVTASVSGVGGNGSGAVLAVTLASGTDYYSGLDYWYVESVAVTNGGSGFYDGAAVTFTVTDGIQEYAASATPNIAREEPEVTASVSSSGGSGASLAVALSQSGSEWAVSSVTISGGGTGYAEWDFLVFSTDGVEAAAAYAIVSGVDGNGAITAISIYYGGSYYKLTGVIESVNVDWGGSYYKSDGIIQSVSLFDGGSYYKEQSTNTSEVDVPQVFISSNVGESAAATAVIDGTLGSPTFGQITAINVTSGGQGYGSGGSRWRATIQYNGEIFHAGVADRVSANSCPTDLLSKSYAMSFSVRSMPVAFDDGCGEPDAETPDSIYGSIMHYRWDGITVSLSPA